MDASFEGSEGLMFFKKSSKPSMFYVLIFRVFETFMFLFGHVLIKQNWCTIALSNILVNKFVNLWPLACFYDIFMTAHVRETLYICLKKRHVQMGAGVRGGRTTGSLKPWLAYKIAIIFSGEICLQQLAKLNQNQHNT